MKSFPTYAAAKKYGDSLASDIATGSEVAKLTVTEAESAKKALGSLKSFRIATGRDVSLDDVVSEWVKATKLIIDGKLQGEYSLAEIVRKFLRDSGNVKRVDLGKAMEDFIAERKLKTVAKEGKRPALSPEHHYNTAIWLREFAKTFPGYAVCDLLAENIRHYISLHAGASPKTRNERRGVVKMFVNWATERDYLSQQHRLLNGEAMKNEDSTPEEIAVYTADELQQILDRASRAPEEGKADYRHLFPVLALAGLAGIRLKEISRLEWQDVFHDGNIVIAATKSKTRSRRVVPVCESLARWLEPYKDKQGKIWLQSYDMLHIDFAALRNELKIKDRRNGLRHSYISAHYALYSDEGLTAKCAGNSPDIVHRDYKVLWDKSRGEAWFAVSPEVPNNVLSLRSKTAAKGSLSP